MKQWQPFNQEFLQKKGFDEDFYPFGYSLQKYKVCSKHYTGDSLLPMGQRLVFIGCKQARKHTDGVNLPTWSAILILRNDGLIAKPFFKSRFNYEPQTPGTVIILNILKYHHCIPDCRVQKRDDSYWIGLSIEYNELPSRDRVETSFREIMELRK